MPESKIVNSILFILFSIYFSILDLELEISIDIPYQLSLLSLLPPSCMVVPIRKVANIHISNSSASYQHFSMTHLPSDMDIDNIRGRSSLPFKPGLRDLSIFLTVSLKAYHKYMECNNNLPDDNIQEPINSSQLFYKKHLKDEVPVSIATDSNNTETPQCVSHKGPILNTMHKLYGKTSTINSLNNVPQETFNIQLPYNIDQAIDQDAWDDSFHPIFIHESIEHIALDIKNVKNSLECISKYILNKKVEKDKINDLENLKGFGKVV